jgi:hypothetical protein
MLALTPVSCMLRCSVSPSMVFLLLLLLLLPGA